MNIPDGRTRYFRITRKDHDIPCWSVGYYAGGPLRFAQFERPLKSDYFYSLVMIENDTTGLFTEVNADGSPLRFTHPDVVGVEPER